jgi:coenzyme F420-0:L-glutamate ligase / coenzyme F420-1:gamma-L-glutamate ligase
MIQIGTNLNIHQFLRSRRTVRRFLPDPVPPEVLARILESTCSAPSAHNRQPWRLVVITSPAGKVSLAVDMGEAYSRDLAADGMPESEIEAVLARSYERITGAPVAVVLCLDISLGDHYPDPDREKAEYLMGVQSVALAGGVLLLAAHAEGIGGVWMCAPLFAPDVVKGSLALPKDWQPHALILLGYPLVIPDPRPCQPLSDIVRFI